MDTTATVPASAPAPPVTHEQLGIGMRLSLHPHCDAFVEVILGALEDVRAEGLDEGLTIETDDVSTYVGATTADAGERLVRYAAALVAAASRRSGGGHVVAHVLLSRGCPGEATCELADAVLPAADPVRVPATRVEAAAQWSLYPLLDGRSAAGDHMAYIEKAIASAQRRGTAQAAAHYATRLAGDVADVLATAADAWAAVGARVPHVVSHLTVSTGSPSGAEVRG